ncbi:MAG: hypothetical protein ACE5IR_18545 [bacterium]
MKKILMTIVLLFGVSGGGLALAEPIAPPVPFTKAYLAKTGKTQKQLDAARIKRVPAKEVVGVPAYPGSYFYQSNHGFEKELISVVLCSQDEPEKVRAWYKANYSGNKKIEIKPFTVYEWQAQIMDIGDMKSEIWIDIKPFKANSGGWK